MTRDEFVTEIQRTWGQDLGGVLSYVCQSRMSESRGWSLTSLERIYIHFARDHGWGEVLRAVADAYDASIKETV